jgi:hypothetical protein
MQEIVGVCFTAARYDRSRNRYFGGAACTIVHDIVPLGD